MRAETLRGVPLSRALRVGPFDRNGGTCCIRQRLVNELERLANVVKLGGDFDSELIVHAKSLERTWGHCKHLGRNFMWALSTESVPWQAC